MNGDVQAQFEYSVVGRSRGQMTLCVFYTVHKKMMSASFLVELQNQGRRVSWLSLKTKVDEFLG
jgi:hypothetical protein